MTPDVTIQVANYFSEEHLAGFVQSLTRNQGAVRWELLVWDNGCSDEEKKGWILSQHKAIRWYSEGFNLGFARAHNELAKHASGRFLIIANPDLRVGVDVVQQLLVMCKENRSIGLVVPAFYFPDGRLQPNQFARQNIWVELAQTFFLDTLSCWNFGISKLRKKLAGECPFPIGWGSGAFSLIPKAAWDELGGYDPCFFFGGEDDDFCRRLWAAGWEVWCEPRAKVYHELHGSIGRELDRKVMYYYQKRLYFAFKHFSPPQYRLLKVVSCGELCCKWFVGLILSLFHQRWKIKTRAYYHTLRMILSFHYEHPGAWADEWLTPDVGREKARV